MSEKTHGSTSLPSPKVYDLQALLRFLGDELDKKFTVKQLDIAVEQFKEDFGEYK